ncbi:MAG: SoxR reducing system RseC family protein, partial [Candidatus Aureabacteria bacterium]|nr:SoxR reducing system RseC family protein [Candidatus Auribacterota bacterium]
NRVKGKVIKKDGRRVELEIIRSGLTCSTCGLCLFGRKRPSCSITVSSDADVASGDIVEIDYSEGRGIWMAFLMFLFPAVLFLIILSASLMLNVNEAASLLFSAAGIVVYFFIIKEKNIYGIKIKKK